MIPGGAREKTCPGSRRGHARPVLATIRIAAPADAAQAAALQQEVWFEAYPDLADSRTRAWAGPQQRIDAWRTWLETIHPSTVTLVAEAGDELAGLCRIGPVRHGEGLDGWGAVQGLMVEPALRRLGVGAHLLGAALEELAALDLLEVSTWALACDVRSLCFWERAGFRRDGTLLSRPDLGTHEVRLVRMEPLPERLPFFG